MDRLLLGALLNLFGFTRTFLLMTFFSVLGADFSLGDIPRCLVLWEDFLGDTFQTLGFYWMTFLLITFFILSGPGNGPFA